MTTSGKVIGIQGESGRLLANGRNSTLFRGGRKIYFLGLRQWAPDHSMSHFNFILRNNKPIGNAIFLLPERTES